MAGSGLNKVMLIGNLGKDPEVRYTPGGQAVANFTIATNESWNDKAGQKQERTEWHRIVAWGKTAELCGEYLTKGRQVYIEGKIQTREWNNKEGVKQYTTEIVANQVLFLAGGERGPGMRRGWPAAVVRMISVRLLLEWMSSRAGPAAEAAEAKAAVASRGGGDDDIPF